MSSIVHLHSFAEERVERLNDGYGISRDVLPVSFILHSLLSLQPEFLTVSKTYCLRLTRIIWQISLLNGFSILHRPLDAGGDRSWSV